MKITFILRNRYLFFYIISFLINTLNSVVDITHIDWTHSIILDYNFRLQFY